MDTIITRRPYCGSVQISQAQSSVTHGAEELIALGIKVAMIRQCQCCTATLRPEAFIVGSPAYKAAQAAKSHT